MYICVCCVTCDVPVDELKLMFLVREMAEVGRPLFDKVVASLLLLYGFYHSYIDYGYQQYILLLP